MENKIVKKCTVRGKGSRECPFGLPVIASCKCAGNCVDRMAAISYEFDDQEKERVTRANKIVYAYCKDGHECKYANSIIDEKEKVNCDFGDTSAGQKTPSFRGSPLYPQTFHGIGVDGLYGYPLGYYSDNAESRNLFFGLFSLIGSNTVDEIVKLGNSYDESGDQEKADIVDNLLEKLKTIRDDNKEQFDLIENYLDEYRKNSDRSDTGLMWELAQKWYSPRQTIQ